MFSTFSVGTELSILLKLGLELGKVKQLLGHFEVVTLENKNLSVFYFAVRSFCLDRTGFIYHREIKIPKYHLSSLCHVTSYLYPQAPTSKSVHRVAMRVARIEFQSGKVSPLSVLKAVPERSI